LGSSAAKRGSPVGDDPVCIGHQTLSHAVVRRNTLGEYDTDWPSFQVVFMEFPSESELRFQIRVAFAPHVRKRRKANSDIFGSQKFSRSLDLRLSRALRPLLSIPRPPAVALASGKR
jgi:hypothetical protein